MSVHIFSGCKERFGVVATGDPSNVKIHQLPLTPPVRCTSCIQADFVGGWANARRGVVGVEGQDGGGCRMVSLWQMVPSLST